MQFKPRVPSESNARYTGLTVTGAVLGLAVDLDRAVCVRSDSSDF